MLRSFPLILGLGLAPVAHADALTDRMVDDVMAAYGGAELLGTVEGYEMDGDSDAMARGEQGSTRRLYAHPDRFRVEMLYPSSVEARVLLGERGFKNTGKGMVPVNGPLLQAMKLQAARAGLPWILADHKPDLRSTDPIELNGELLQGVELTVETGLLLRVWVDPETHYIRRSQSILEGPPMAMSFETIYSEHKPVDGVIFAHREDNKAATTPTAIITFTEIRTTLGGLDFNQPAPPLIGNHGAAGQAGHPPTGGGHGGQMPAGHGTQMPSGHGTPVPPGHPPAGGQ